MDRPYDYRARTLMSSSTTMPKMAQEDIPSKPEQPVVVAEPMDIHVYGRGANYISNQCGRLPWFAHTLASSHSVHTHFPTVYRVSKKIKRPGRS